MCGQIMAAILPQPHRISAPNRQVSHDAPPILEQG